MNIKKIVRMGDAIQEYLIDNILVDAKPKGFLSMLIQKVGFNQDYQ